MASNHMNSWDDDSDERMRRHWQGAFADFEVQPRSSLSRRILNQLSSGRRRRAAGWLAGLLLLMSAGALYQIRFTKRPVSIGTVKTTHPAVSNHAFTPNHTIQRKASDEHLRKTEPVSTESRPEEAIANRQPTAPRPSALEVTTPKNSQTGTKVLRSYPTSPEQPIVDKAGLWGQIKKTVRTTSTPNDPSVSQSFHSDNIRFPGNSSEPASAEQLKQLQAPTGRLAGVHPLSTNDASISAIRLLKPRGFVFFPSPLNVQPNQLPAISSAPQYLTKTVIARPIQRWFVDAEPLSSFQWMSVLPASAGYLSQIHAPAAFSPTTWGYQLNGGIRFGR